MEKTRENNLTTIQATEKTIERTFDEIIQKTNEYTKNVKFKNKKDENLFRTLIAAAVGITLVYSIQRALIKYLK